MSPSPSSLVYGLCILTISAGLVREDPAVDEEVPGADLHGRDHRHACVEAGQGVGARAALWIRAPSLLPLLCPLPAPPGFFRAPDVNLARHQGAPPLQALAHRPLRLRLQVTAGVPGQPALLTLTRISSSQIPSSFLFKPRAGFPCSHQGRWGRGGSCRRASSRPAGHCCQT